MRALALRSITLTIALSAGTALAGCTFSVAAPVDAPPNAWNPALDTHPDSAAFRKLLEQYVQDGLPGVVLWVRTPRGQWNGAAGYARIESSVPMRPTHRFFAASVTKMYTAAAVLLLAEDGVIDLDAPIREYLPAAVWKRVPNGDEATVRQLLGHTSGIPDFSGSLAYELDTLDDPLGSYPPDRLLGYLEGQSPISAPGRSWFYSNANYLLLALLVDAATGSGLADMISERVLQPLGLHDTFYKNESGYPTPPGLVNGYQDFAGDGRLMNVSDLTVHSAEMSIGYSGLIATAADLAAFIDALFEGRIVGPTSLARMQERTASQRYGLGLSFMETPYGPAIGHSGGDTGTLSQVRYFPDADATLVLLVNGGDSGITETLFSRLWDEAVQLAGLTLRPRPSGGVAPGAAR